MPGKSRRSRRFAQQQQKQSNQPATPAQPAAATAQSSRPAPRASQPSAGTLPHYPYVGTEMVRIGIITVAVIVILFVLAAVLPRA